MLIAYLWCALIVALMARSRHVLEGLWAYQTLPACRNTDQLLEIVGNALEGVLCGLFWPLYLWLRLDR